MRRLLSLLSALTLCGSAAPALSRTADPRPRVSAVVVTLDQVRQIQVRHGRTMLGLLGDERWGQFEWAEPAVAPDLFEPCVDRQSDGSLDYCVRYYLTRAQLAADAPPTVVVVFDDRRPPERQRGEMEVTCYGRGVVPADRAAQDTWLWPGSAQIHGVRDWDRDRDALAACITAAASEAWTGLREPDPD